MWFWFCLLSTIKKLASRGISKMTFFCPVICQTFNSVIAVSTAVWNVLCYWCRYLRVVGTHNTVNRVFHLVSFECFYTDQPCTLDNGIIGMSPWPIHTHAHNCSTALLDTVCDYPGELAPEGKTKKVKQCRFTGARDSEWQWHQLGHMQICTLTQTDNHASTPPLSFFTGRMPFLPPNQQCQSTFSESLFLLHFFQKEMWG